jgi:hypothetical protein
MWCEVTVPIFTGLLCINGRKRYGHTHLVKTGRIFFLNKKWKVGQIRGYRSNPNSVAVNRIRSRFGRLWTVSRPNMLPECLVLAI